MSHEPTDDDVGPVPPVPRVSNTRAVGTIGQGTLKDSPVPKSMVRAWALWDWGSASFNAVVTTFVFSTYLASSLFIDPAIVAAAGDNERDAALVAAEAANTTVISGALTIAGAIIAVLAPILGQRSDGSGRRKFWLAINTGLVVLAMLAMFFVAPVPAYLYLGAALLAIGNIFFEFASVNYNAMLVQVSTPATVGRVSGFGWGMGYVGGIVLLVILLVLFIGTVGGIAAGGLLGLPAGGEEGSFDIRLAIVFSALWFAVFAIPVFLKVPEIPKTDQPVRVGMLASYRKLWGTIVGLRRKNPSVLLFLLASAVFRDGLAGVFTLGAVIAAVVFGFSTGEVLTFGVAANVFAGIGTFIGGWIDDRFGAKRVIIGSLIGLIIAGSAVLFIGEAKTGFWIAGLFLTLFVGPVQAASRSFLSRITPPGREGEIFGLYATTGRAVSFLAPGLFSLFVATTGDTRFGIVGIVLVLLAGLLLMLPVKAKQSVIE